MLTLARALALTLPLTGPLGTPLKSPTRRLEAKVMQTVAVDCNRTLAFVHSFTIASTEAAFAV